MTAQLTPDHISIKIGDLNITIRPITPDDKVIEAAFVRDLSPQTRHDRFLGGIRELSPSMLTQLCNIDYVNSMAYVATILEDGDEKEIGVCRYANDSVLGEREMAVTVADEYQHFGIATLLVNKLIEHARANGVKRLTSIDLRTNYKMQELAESLGMVSMTDPEDPRQVIFSITL
jgi:GNAT superfamily N-acetyltransferase